MRITVEVYITRDVMEFNRKIIHFNCCFGKVVCVFFLSFFKEENKDKNNDDTQNISEDNNQTEIFFWQWWELIISKSEFNIGNCTLSNKYHPRLNVNDIMIQMKRTNTQSLIQCNSYWIRGILWVYPSYVILFFAFVFKVIDFINFFNWVWLF